MLRNPVHARTSGPGIPPDLSLSQIQHTAWTAKQGAPTDIWALTRSFDGFPLRDALVLGPDKRTWTDESELLRDIFCYPLRFGKRVRSSTCPAAGNLADKSDRWLSNSLNLFRKSP